jgi:hypothetical protein
MNKFVLFVAFLLPPSSLGGWVFSSSPPASSTPPNRADRTQPAAAAAATATATAARTQPPTCANPNDPACDARSPPRKKKWTPLRPRDLPNDHIFSNWTTTDEFVELPLSVHQRYQVSTGEIQQNGDSESFSSFYKLHNIVEDEEVLDILTTIKGTAPTANGPTVVPLDDDPDTVDGMPTREIFVDNIELRQGKPSKSDAEGSSMRAEAKMKLRAKMRKKLQDITHPILRERITPYVRQRYPHICGGEDAEGNEDPTRACTPCFSLIRRYVEDERTSHSIHHDGHALVTVVVSLSVRGEDYQGGLYIATKTAQKQYVGLTRGDAVVHQGDLYHGVKVLPSNAVVHLEEEVKAAAEDDDEDEDDEDEEEAWGEEHDDGVEEGEAAETATKKAKEKREAEVVKVERWSWILWYRDSLTCDDHGYEWYKDCAEEGNPTCELLHATKVPNVPGLTPKQQTEQVLLWNQKASDHGHGGASIKLARAHLKLLPSPLVYNPAKAKALYYQAIRTSNHPDAHYGLASLFITPQARGKILRKAVIHLEQAAAVGHSFAAFNLALAHLYGYGMPKGRRNADIAGEWFEHSGLPEGLWAKAMHIRSKGKEKEAQEYETHAKKIGFGLPWRRIARKNTGSGGAAGVTLNLNWPKVGRRGEKPPEW